MAQIWIDVLGTVAALCSMTSFAPQVVKIWRSRDASSVSLRMYVVTVAGFALWTGYGMALQSWPLIASNLISLGMSGAVLLMKLRFGEGEGGEPPSLSARAAPPRAAPCPAPPVPPLR